MKNFSKNKNNIGREGRNLHVNMRSTDRIVCHGVVPTLSFYIILK